MADSPSTMAGNRRWTWVGRIADVQSLGAFFAPIALSLAAGVSPPHRDLRELLLLLAGVAALAAGMALTARAMIERGDAFLPVDVSRNYIVSVRLWVGSALAVVGVALTIVFGIALAR